MLSLAEVLHRLLQLLLLLGVHLPSLALLQLLNLLLGLLQLLLGLIQGLRIGLVLGLLNLLHRLAGCLNGLLVLLVLLLLPLLLVVLLNHKTNAPFFRIFGGRLKKPTDSYCAAHRRLLYV